MTVQAAKPIDTADLGKIIVGVSEKFYILWSPKGECPPRVVYAKPEDARPEAERLARKTSGPIYVMCPIEICMPAEPPVVWHKTEE